MRKEKTVEDILFYFGNALIVLLLIGWPLFTDFLTGYVRGCLFNRVTGLYCPACGGTRAFSALIHGHLLLSIRLNPIVLYFFVCFGWFMISWYIQKLSRNRWIVGMKFKTVYVYVGLVLLIGNCLIKNFILLMG